MEIVNTGALERINHERTEDVEVVNIFKGIYGVGELGVSKFIAPALPLNFQAPISHTNGSRVGVEPWRTLSRERVALSCQMSRRCVPETLLR